jgi:hypothetical protein
MANNTQVIDINEDMRKDLAWFIKCAAHCNGTVNIKKDFIPHIDLYLDASFKGMGACWGNNVYKIAYSNPDNINIAHLEAINIIAALKVWGNNFKGRNVRVWCDNIAAVAVLNNSKGQDPGMQCIARNLWLWASSLDINIQFQHVRGENNVIADMLSRWDAYNNPHAQLFSLLNDLPIWAYPTIDDLYLNTDI